MSTAELSVLESAMCTKRRGEFALEASVSPNLLPPTGWGRAPSLSCVSAVGVGTKRLPEGAGGRSAHVSLCCDSASME